ncbi:MAG: acetate/propionate family kinase [bacterium]
MKILVLNSGSSSIKFQLFNMESEEVLAKGQVSRINNDNSKLSYETSDDEIKKDIKIADHGAGLEVIKEILVNEEVGVVADINDIEGIGHRVVHGGEKYSESTLVDETVEKNIDELSSLAPLHNPHNLKGIQVCKKLIPDTSQVAVFDTSFHQTLPQKAYLYGLPYRYYEKYGIRRYGFHGTSHKYVSQRAARMMEKPITELNIITCHIGNGASMTAVKKGKSVETSMGLTPLEGLVMGTRSGDLDPSIVPFLVEREDISALEVERILNKESGLLGVSGISNDYREVKQAADNGNERAQAALDIFYHRMKKYIGSYTAVMGSLDAIVFTGGCGENEGTARASVLENMSYLGVEIDKQANQVRSEEQEISTQNSDVKVFVIPTNEELVIARETKKLLE